MPDGDLVPDSATILRWIEAVFERGVRRPGYAADRWTERFCLERFSEFGLENVRLEPVRVPYWEPRASTLRIRSQHASIETPCSPLPFSAPTPPVDLELAHYDAQAPSRVAGRASLYDVSLLRVPPAFWVAGDASRVFDPGGTFEGAVQVLPFGAEIQAVMEPSIAAGAAAFVGCLVDYPGDSFEYYAPYDAVSRPIPGVWIRGSDGRRLRSLLDRGLVEATLAVDAERSEVRCHNVVGELPGADDETVVIGSHHDGPWSSAVEDGSGIALVLAQAAYWSRVPRAERPHRLVFLLNAGHMAGGAGCRAFLDDHSKQLDEVVMELHLEHAAREFAEQGGELAPTGQSETRWWFTSRVPRLEDAVRSAVAEEGLGRSLILPPDAIGPHPTTDGGFFHLAGVPLVNLLTAPFYLFDSMDRMDKVDAASLVPITRAAVRIVESTRGVSAAGMRAST